MFLWNLLKSFDKTLGEDFPQTSFKTFPQVFPQALWKFPHKKKRIAFFVTGSFVFSLALPQIMPASAQSTQATVQEILDGNQVFIQNQQAFVNDVARAQQQVRTGNSRTALLFDTGAVARLSANSVLRIGQCAQLRSGTILVNGAINACSSGITTGVRGTTYLLEVDELGNQRVKVLEGEVIVKRNTTKLIDDDEQSTNNKPIDKPSNTKLPAKTPNGLGTRKPLDPNLSSPKQPDEVVLKSGEKIEVDRVGALGIIQKLTENEFVNLLQGNLFQGFVNQIPGIDKVRSVFNGLFPGVNFPISIPQIPTPSIPLPSLPRFPIWVC